TIAKPLHCLLEKSVKYEWKEAQEKAFNELKDHLISAPVLWYPDFNCLKSITHLQTKIFLASLLEEIARLFASNVTERTTYPFYLHTDTSGTSLGAVLAQKDDNK
ncbi:20984_t:CDS:2, partial [Gigaspora rosea]